MRKRAKGIGRDQPRAPEMVEKSEDGLVRARQSAEQHDAGEGDERRKPSEPANDPARYGARQQLIEHGWTRKQLRSSDESGRTVSQEERRRRKKDQVRSNFSSRGLGNGGQRVDPEPALRSTAGVPLEDVADDGVPLRAAQAPVEQLGSNQA